MKADFRIDAGTLYAILPDVEVQQPDWLIAIWSEPDYTMGVSGGLTTVEKGWAYSGDKVKSKDRYAGLLQQIKDNYGDDLEIVA